MPTTEQATREAAAILHDVAGLTVDPATAPIVGVLHAIIDWETSHFPSDGEEALANLVFAIWNGNRDFTVRDLAKLDRQNRERAIGAIKTWVEATS